MRALGPFALQTRLGAGGMAEVWKARHRDTAQQVAIKFLVHPDGASSAFRTEVDAMARLDHVGIVRIHDFGTLDTRIRTPAGHHLEAGLPFIVMDLAAGSMVQRPMPSRWSEMQRLALSVLDALAHAHARGVIHRDLKPGNILISADPSAHVLLSDFGIAVAARARAHATGTMSPGTPTHMAPELFRGTWRRYGPWTDIYALAVIVWQLTHGQVPYDGTFFQIASGHLDSDLPPFAPRLATPPGLEAWLRRALAKNPEDRFAFAAHAATALGALAHVAPETEAEPETVAVETTPTILTGPDAGSLPPSTEDGATIARPRTPNGDLPPTHAAMLGTGLSLLGLRPPPFVGRVGARRALWSALQATIRDRTVHAIVLRGPVGVGKRRLANWLAHTAHEGGNARFARVQFQPGHHSVRDAVTDILTHHFRAWGLEGADVELAIDRAARGILSDPERQLLRRLLDGSRADELPLGALRHALGVCARRGPQIIVLEDVHHAPDVAALVEETLRVGTTGLAGLLFVMTEVPSDRSAAARLQGHQRATMLDVPPLPEDTIRTLLEREIGLTARLSRHIAGRSEGIPLFAVEHVLDLARRGGFSRAHGRLDATVDLAVLPKSLQDLCVERILGVARQVGAGSRPAMHMLAALGQEIDIALWQECCQDASVSIPPALEATLIAQRLATPTPAGFDIANRVIHESLVALAKRAGAWSRHNRLAANRLQTQRATRDDPRIGPMLLHAQLHRAALPTLLRAGERHIRNEEYIEARKALQLLTVAADALSLPAHDDRRIRADQLLASVYLTTEQPDRALEHARRALAHSTATSNHARMPAAATSVAAILEQGGDLRAAAGAAREAVELARRVGAPDDEAGALNVHARISLRLGDAEACLRAARTSLAIAGRHKLVDRQCSAHYMLGWVLTTTRDYEEAVRHLRASLDLADQLGASGRRSIALSGLAEVQRFCGQTRQSIATYRQCVELQTACGVFDAVNHVNLGLALATDGDAHSALEPLERALTWATECGRKMVAACAQIGLAWASAQLGEWDDTVQYVSAGLAGVDRVGLVDRDIACALHETAVLLLAANRAEIAGRLVGVAVRQWEGLGNPEPDAGATRRLAAQLQSG
jgi:eukaryotic-like serine/threonine-protein kinase